MGLLVLVGAGCGRGGGEEVVEQTEAIPGGAPIVLISVDTLRSDRLPAYGYDAIETPAIDALRSDGILYERAYSPVPLTLPAHASLLTGLLPPGHGVRDNAGYRLAVGGPPTLPELLGEAGYTTGGAVSAFVMRRETGLARGFDAYDDALEGHDDRATISEIQRPGGETLGAALQWLDAAIAPGRDQPFFLFFHIYEPHTPYDPPEPFASRYGSPYDGEVAESDRIVGDLVSALADRGLYEASTVILLSDHGEGLGDHGEDEHGVLLYREAIQIPLILKLPGNRRAGSTVTAPVQLTDVMPTLLELAGTPGSDRSQADFDGLSLLKVEEQDAPRPLYAETYHPRIRFGWSELRSLVDGRYHYIRSPRSELYDLVADPAETEDLIREERRVYARLRDRLDTIDPRFERPFEETSETRQALASLGYLGGTAGDADTSINPGDHLDALRNLQQAIGVAQTGDFAGALPGLRQATSQIPRSIDAWQFLGLALQKTGQAREALEAYEKAFDLSNGAPALARPMARLALDLGEVDDALVYLDVAIEDAPGEPRLRFLKTRTLLFAGRLDEAAEEAREILEKMPESPDAHYQAGAIAMARRNLDTAERHFRDALETAPRHPAALNDLSVLLMSQGRKEEARPLLERLVEVQPGNRAARATLDALNASNAS